MDGHLVTSLRTGALRAELADGMLHDVRLGDALLLDAVYVAVRDPDWGTVPAVLDDVDVRTGRTGFTVGYRAHHANGFFWRGRLTGEDGRITFAMDGVAVRDLRANRIGFCLLHPQELAGVPVTLHTPDGPVDSRFPEAVSAHQPFPDLVGMTYRGLRIDLSGELFETEDQRNWTDPSFKTYGTPLRTGFPRAYPADTPVRQRVELSGTGTGPASTRLRRRDPARVHVGAPPSDLRLAPLGLALPSEGGPLTPAEARAVAACRPAHLWVEADLRPAADPAALARPAGESWPDTLERAAHDAAALDVPLHVEAVAEQPGDLAPLVDALAALAAHGTRVDRLMVFDGSWTTGRAAAEHARALLDHAGLERVRVGGGSRAHYAEFNRADLAGVPLDVYCYSLSPQVHAFDDASVMGTLRAQPATLAGARAAAGRQPVAVGPVTLRPRFNAVATGLQPPTPPGRLPPQVDPRQAGWFAAAWAVGCRAVLAGADSLTLFEAAGRRGLLARDGQDPHPLFPAEPGVPYPAHAVLAALAGWSGHRVLATAVLDRRVAALAVDLPDGPAAAVANLTSEPVRAGVDLDGRHPDRVTPVGGEPAPGTPVVTLGPYRVAVCRWRHPAEGRAR